MKRLIAAALLTAALGASGRSVRVERASATFVSADVPYLPGSVIPLELNGILPPYHVALVGPGNLTNRFYTVPQDASGSAALIASNATGLAQHTFDFAAPPDPSHDFIAVASYNDGIVIHEARAPFTMTAALAIGGAPGDVAIDARGAIGTGATDEATATIAHLQPWQTATYGNVPFTDEVAFDAKTGALFLTNRDVNGPGAITRIGADGSQQQRILGLTSEGLAIDPVRRRVYVANVNDATISVVDADSLVELRRFKAVERVFALALSAHGSRLYAVSNQSLTSPFAAAGGVVAFDVRATPMVVARSAPLVFPVGVALDPPTGRLFVTDEHDDDVYVLNARTLAPVHAPLHTCRTPWKPTVDAGLLYVPCARADEID
ncbi:MAG TPA: hypothetical protein VNF68_04195, partial [Candidatus Baltobacteraceae bacterium]|nr:hypothetical protein [Candidatus Baltobacteraceae bacterium]